MKPSANDNTKRSEDQPPSRPKSGKLSSPRAEAFKTGRKVKKDGASAKPFDLGRYRDIFSETD